MFLHNGRYVDVQKVVAGFKQTGIPLVMSDGATAMPYDTQGADDIGIYLFIPKLARLFNLTADQAIAFFFYGIFAFSLFLTIVGFFLLYKTVLQRTIALVATISIFTLALKINDVYIISHLLAFGCIPLFIYCCKKNHEWMITILFLMGIAVGFGNYLRAHAGWGIFIFMAIVLMLYSPFTRFKRSACFLALLMGMGTATGYIYYNYYQYHRYAAEHFAQLPVTTPHHTFWHTLYVGLGFVGPFSEIRWADDCGHAKAKEIDPTITGARDYDNIEKALRTEFLRMVVHQPFFIGAIMFAKLGTLFFFLLKCAHLFFLAILYRLLYRWSQLDLFDGAFMLLIAFNSLYPLVAIPITEYSIGFISATLLYGITVVNHDVVAWMHYYVRRYRRTSVAAS